MWLDLSKFDNQCDNVDLVLLKLCYIALAGNGTVLIMSVLRCFSLAYIDQTGNKNINY